MRIVLPSSLLLLAACSSTIQSSHVPSVFVDLYRRDYFDSRPEVLLEEPKKAYLVVGLIEVRTSRPYGLSRLLDELVDHGSELKAEAIIPGHKPNSDEEGATGVNGYLRYFTVNDGRVQVLEAQAIRFPFEAEQIDDR